MRTAVSQGRRCVGTGWTGTSLRSLPRFGSTADGSTAKSGKSHGIYPGNVEIPYVSELSFSPAEPEVRWPCYRVMDEDGSIRPDATDPNLGRDEVVGIYETMIRLQSLDQIFYDAQRQGRISFYMTNSGEEGMIASAAALSNDDMVFGQYREAGILMHRGFSLQEMADQCFSNVDDVGKGRQMPIHYGSKIHNYQTISSPLATQLPQASGAAYRAKLRKDGTCVTVYFGDGAASEGDFHPALNFAATLDCPLLLFCRNNGYAISTPVADQYRGDGIVSRGPGYGISSIRIDGNDVLAVYQATKEARKIAVTENRPVLIEAMTYRQGHHSTSDDSTRYRDVDEIQFWRENDNPIDRLRMYMTAQGWWDEDRDKSLRDTERRRVLEALTNAENKGSPGRETLFEDVYAEKPQHLQDQETELLEHIAKYPDKYVSNH